MQSCRCRLFSCAFCDPLLGLTQVFATKQEAAVFALPFPFLSAEQQPGMILGPNQVCIESFHQGCKLRVKITAINDLYSLKSAKSFGHYLVWNGSIEDRNHPLVVGCGVIDFFLAVRGSH